MNNQKPSYLVMQNVLDLIFSGKIEPGEKLPSAESISRQAGVSIASAREALQNLEAIGLLDIVHGRGIYVTEGGPIIEEILDARSMLECHNVEMAARKINKASLERLHGLVDDMERALSNGDFRLFSEIDHGFHVAIAKIAGNRFLFKVFENTKSLLFYQQLQVNFYPGNPEVAIKQHRKMLDALAKRDPIKAREAMAEHLKEALRVWKKAIETQSKVIADSAESDPLSTSINSTRR